MEYASHAVGTAGLTTGIIGTSLGALNALGGLGNVAGLFGGNRANNDMAAAALGASLANGGCNPYNGWGPYNGCCSENQPVNRYELQLQQKIAEQGSMIALRDANTYQDQKMLEMYKYLDGQLKDIRSTLCDQAVHNQRTEDSFALARQDIAAVEERLTGKIRLEAERRCCADNSIVTYANATFYPKQVADVTVGTATTAQTLYNPIPKCGCDCGCGQ